MLTLPKTFARAPRAPASLMRTRCSASRHNSFKVGRIFSTTVSAPMIAPTSPSLSKAADLTSSSISLNSCSKESARSDAAALLPSAFITASMFFAMARRTLQLLSSLRERAIGRAISAASFAATIFPIDMQLSTRRHRMVSCSSWTRFSKSPRNSDLKTDAPAAGRILAIESNAACRTMGMSSWANNFSRSIKSCCWPPARA
mmetsp:Transcript_269/g.359  ORF Transcript_269/g.359 Transcript_269/m.359 type:complete len:202 (-) Transcript_269:618-1223(-)